MEGLLLAEPPSFVYWQELCFLGKSARVKVVSWNCFLSATLYFSLGASAHSVADGTLLKLFGRVAIHAW